jgi:hypothetical protein
LCPYLQIKERNMRQYYYLFEFSVYIWTLVFETKFHLPLTLCNYKMRIDQGIVVWISMQGNLKELNLRNRVFLQKVLFVRNFMVGLKRFHVQTISEINIFHIILKKYYMTLQLLIEGTKSWFVFLLNIFCLTSDSHKICIYTPFLFFC